jgi:hypothetical protein
MHALGENGALDAFNASDQASLLILAARQMHSEHCLLGGTVGSGCSVVMISISSYWKMPSNWSPSSETRCLLALAAGPWAAKLPPFTAIALGTDTQVVTSNQKMLLRLTLFKIAESALLTPHQQESAVQPTRCAKASRAAQQ